VYQALTIPTMVVSFLVAAWCFVAARRDRWIDWSHLIGLILVEVAVIAQAIVAVLHIASGERPEHFVTFLGYLVTTVIMLPLVVVLSFMERTRWGSVIAGAGGIVVAVLVLRLQQVWTPLR
jgi:drug/metabolite transporter (DMT)-like permease